MNEHNPQLEPSEGTPDLEQDAVIGNLDLLPPNKGTSVDKKRRALRNRRRVELIHKELEEGLDPAEEKELHGLQAEMSRYLDALMPLPFDLLEEIRDCARRDGLPIPPRE